MKKLTLLFFVLLWSFSMHAQLAWLADLKQSQSMARQLDKLILIDFWADWCGPCKLMDKELWHHTEMYKLSSSLIWLKVNVDIDKETALEYNTQLIPKVVLNTITSETIWESSGYRDVESYLPVLVSIPENVKTLNDLIIKLQDNKDDCNANFRVGQEFQQIGKDLKNKDLKYSFLALCEKYLSKARKHNNDAGMTEEIQLYSSLNDVYWTNYKKALKKITKINIATSDNHLTELRHFILAMCYKNTNDFTEFQKEKQLISTKEYLVQLENL